MADIIQPHNENNRAAPGTTVVADDPAPNSGAKESTRRNVGFARPNFDGLQINVWYFKSVPGILKVVEWVIGIICIACASPPYLDAAHWFVFVAVLCFIFTFVWACIHFFSLTSVINLPWLLIEMGYTALAMLLYFIAFIVLLVETAKYEYAFDASRNYQIYYHPTYNFYRSYLAAGSFGVFNFIAYAIETLFHAKTYFDTRKEPAT